MKKLLNVTSKAFRKEPIQVTSLFLAAIYFGQIIIRLIFVK